MQTAAAAAEEKRNVLIAIKAEPQINKEEQQQQQLGMPKCIAMHRAAVAIGIHFPQQSQAIHETI
jgi:hypothetical protein